MRCAFLPSVCVSLAMLALCNGAEFSEVRDLPPLKLGANDLDAILMETNAFIDGANGSRDSGWDVVKLTIDGENIEIPHLSQASSVAFPNELFRFSYAYQQTGKPISSVTIDLGDSLRRVSVTGESADKVRALSKLLEGFSAPLNCCWRAEIPPRSRDMSFDAVFVVINDQWRVLLE